MVPKPGDARPSRLLLDRVAAFLAAIILVWGGISHYSLLPADDVPESNNQGQKPRAEALRLMRTRADSVDVLKGDSADQKSIRLLAEPLLRYSDVPRNILDATLWAWGEKGRPQAFLKVEAHRWESDQPPQVTWISCFSSVSPERINAKWKSGRRFETREPGLKLIPVSDAAQPAETLPSRLSQMKELARRFSATIDTTGQDSRQEMRQLPTPLHHYADPDAGIHDGTVFGFTTHGTNPDMLLLIEVHSSPDKDATWNFALARMTIGQLSVRLDGKVVYEAPFTGYSPGGFATWAWFFEKGALTQE
jgi:hypothetical protein